MITKVVWFYLFCFGCGTIKSAGRWDFKLTFNTDWYGGKKEEEGEVLKKILYPQDKMLGTVHSSPSLKAWGGEWGEGPSVIWFKQELSQEFQKYKVNGDMNKACRL